MGRRIGNVAPSAKIADKSVLKLVKRDKVNLWYLFVSGAGPGI